MLHEKNINCIVVDDDLIDRLTTVSFLKNYPFIKILGEFESPLDALVAAKKINSDVLFLDIDMDELSGLQLRQQLMQIPCCIFITSYPEYALESFELEAFDFLVKPFTPERFDKMINRLHNYFDIRHKSDLLSHTIGAGTIFIKEGTNQIKLQLHDIIYLEAMKDYTSIITNNKKYMVLEALGNLIKEKMFSSFVRIHRSYAVQKHFVKKYNSSEVILNNNTTLPVGRVFKDTLKEFF